MRRVIVTVALAAAGAAFGARQEFPVGGEGWRKVRVGFMARVTDGRCFESNAMLRVSQANARLPMYSVVQASSKPGTRLVNRRGNFRSFIFSSAWRPYVRELWVEPEADRVVLSTPDAGVEVKDVRMKAVNDGKIALNGDFRLGPFNYSGIQSVERVGRVEPGEDGRGQLNAVPRGAVHTEPVPLKPETNYRVMFVWNCPGERGMRVHNHFLAADGKKATDFHWTCSKAPRGKNVPDPEPAWYVSETTFRTKENVAALSMQIYHGVVKSYSIEEVE